MVIILLSMFLLSSYSINAMQLFKTTLRLIPTIKTTKPLILSRNFIRSSKNLSEKFSPFINFAEGRTALHRATTIEDAQKLIDEGVPINAQDDDGNTALHCIPALLVPLFIRHHADLTIKNKKTFFITAEQNPRTWSEAKYWEHVYYPYAKEFWNLRKEENKNFDVDYMGHYDHLTCDVYKGLTPAMEAVIAGHHDKIKSLQEHAPQQVMKEIKALQLIAMRTHFDLHYCSQPGNYLPERDDDSPRKMYHDLCNFEVKMYAQQFLKDLIK